MTVTDGEQIDSGPIVVSSKTLGLISAGIYRSPASAIKELVSNAFDADAEWVEISMNPPSFDMVSITDNGAGIKLDKFLDLMKGQIGDSDKRAHGLYTEIKHRPLIGRIGIGLLAIAQICHGFEVISHHRKSGSAFRAQIQLSDELEEHIDEVQIDTINSMPKLDIGTFQLFEIPFDKTRCGTSIIATDLKYGFLRRLMRGTPETRPAGNVDSQGVEDGDTPASLRSVTVSVEVTAASQESLATPEAAPPLPKTFGNFFQRMARQRTIREVSEYWRTTWGIALSAPLPYVDSGPVREQQVMVERQKELESYDFHVYVDGLPLRRPVLLPAREKDLPRPQDAHVEILNLDSDVGGTRLQGQGYIYSQGGKSIYPAELRGMLIRIKGVAIGEYDRNFLDFEFAEGPRLNWMSGEIDMEEGLEDALNIDRDSFNQSHPHYIEIQNLIHEALNRHIRPWLYRNMDARASERKDAESSQRERDIVDTVTKILPDAKIERIRQSSTAGRQDSFESPVQIDSDQRRIKVNVPCPQNLVQEE